MPIHKDLPESELHPPKGFLPASPESFPIKNASGLLEWISTSNLGSKWHTGAGEPAPTLGRTGDFYLDADVGDFYEKVNFNTWTLRGNVDGSDWFKGSGPPAPSLGRVQDFYIDIDEGDLYEKTTPTTWVLITNIDGSDWFQGAGPPASSLGREQDFYIDKITGDLYEKNSPTTWDLFANITGPQGPVGPMANVSDDTTPELGGDLDGQGHNISNVGTYNGVTVEAHASRHAPGGADPIATGTPSTQTPDQANAEGNANSLARANHTHNIPTAAAVGLDANSGNTQGSNPSFARSNHTHAIASAPASTQTPDQANAAGASPSFAKADHTHNIPTASAVGLDANSPNAQGSNPSFARSNHTHAIASGPPSTQTPDQANAAGVSPSFAKADHNHNIPTASAVGLDVNSPNAQGSNPSFARSNHTHAIASGPASTQTPDQPNAAGVSPSFAKADHGHNIPTAPPQNTGAANAQGAADSFARSDHVHNTFPVFEANSAAIETSQTTTSAAFQTGLTLNANGLVGGLYKIEWYYEWGYDSETTDFFARVQVNNTQTIMDHRENPADSGGTGPGGTDQRMPQSGFAIVPLAAGNHFIDLDYSSSGGGVQATLWRARILLRRWG